MVAFYKIKFIHLYYLLTKACTLEKKREAPTPLRLGKLKPHLERMAFIDVHSKSTHNFMYKILEGAVLADKERGPIYRKEIENSKIKK